ncbi:hypothetical protein Tco_1548247 [Tanacetum coccineum]
MVSSHPVFPPLTGCDIKHSVLNANSELICATCHECMFNAIHDLCVSDYLNDLHACVKSKSVKSRYAKSKKKKMWKPTGKVYTNVGCSWRPTERTFTIDGNMCPLTRIISTKVVPLRKSISTTPVKQTQPSSNKYGNLKDIKNVGSSSKSKAGGAGQGKLGDQFGNVCSSIGDMWRGYRLELGKASNSMEVLEVTLGGACRMRVTGYEATSFTLKPSIEVVVIVTHPYRNLVRDLVEDRVVEVQRLFIWYKSLWKYMLLILGCRLFQFAGVFWFCSSWQYRFSFQMNYRVASSDPLAGKLVVNHGYGCYVVVCLVVCCSLKVVIVCCDMGGWAFAFHLGQRHHRKSTGSKWYFVFFRHLLRENTNLFPVFATKCSSRDGVPVGNLYSGDGAVDLIGDEDPIDEDGDIGVGDLEVSVEEVGGVSGGVGNSLSVASYACMISTIGSSCKGEKTSMSKRYLVKSFEELGELFSNVAGK